MPSALHYILHGQFVIDVYNHSFAAHGPEDLQSALRNGFVIPVLVEEQPSLETSHHRVDEPVSFVAPDFLVELVNMQVPEAVTFP